MRNPIRKASVFISYAREDAKDVDVLYQELKASGFHAYHDTHETLIGEDFTNRIRAELRDCDAVVPVVSPRSVCSEWCQAEIYHANAIGKAMTPVRLGTEPVVWPRPLDSIMRELNYETVNEPDELRLAVVKVRQRLSFAKARRRKRIAASIGIVVALIALATWLASDVVARVNMWTVANDREATKDRILRSETIVRRDVINHLASEHREDEVMVSRLLLIRENSEHTPLQRLNASIAADALLGPRNASGRQYLQDLTWAASDFSGGSLVETTFASGRLHDVRFDDVSFSGVAWGPGENLTVSSCRFEECRFWGGQVSGTKMLAVDFENSMFYGTYFGVSEFSQVRFRSAEKSSPHVVGAGRVTALDRCVIERLVVDEPPPDADQRLDFTSPNTEVSFTNVVFETCVFRGDIPPSWFRGCSFTECQLPPRMKLSELEAGENHVVDCSWTGG